MMKKRSLFIILRVNASSTLPLPVNYSYFQVNLWMFSEVKKNTKKYSVLMSYLTPFTLTMQILQ